MSYRFLRVELRFKPCGEKSGWVKHRLGHISSPTSIATRVFDADILKAGFFDDDLGDSTNATGVIGAQIEAIHLLVGRLGQMDHCACAIHDLHVRFFLTTVSKHFKAGWIRLEFVDEIKDGGYITPVESSGDFLTYVSRIRDDQTQKNSINMWVVSDNLLKGAALNAVQIANVLIKKYIN